jgi:hypothetical protein
MRKLAVVAAALAIVFVQAGSANAAKNRHHLYGREASRTVVQPTRTIIHNPDGTTTIIVTPRRSYLDPGTEVSPGEARSMDYAFPPGGDPGRSGNWFYGPDMTNTIGGFSPAWPFYMPGYNPDNPF